MSSSAAAGADVFGLTQVRGLPSARARTPDDIEREIAELEVLLAGTNQTSQSTQLLKKRKEIREVDEALVSMKREYNARVEACDERRKVFEGKQAKLRDQVTKFEKFIQENDQKRQRAEAKTKLERGVFDQKCAELVMMTEKIAQMEHDKTTTLAMLASKNAYTAYLQATIAVSEQGFEDASDLIARYDNLRESNRDLLTQAQGLENRVGEMRSRLQALEMEAQNQLLVGTSQFQACQKRFEQARLESKEEEEAKNDTEDKKKDVAREVTQVIASIKNIYGRCVGSMKFSPTALLPRDATLQQTLWMNLEVIADRLVDMNGIYEDYKVYQADPDRRNDMRGDNSTVLGTDSQMDADTSMYSGGGGTANSAEQEKVGFPTKKLMTKSTGDLHGRTGSAAGSGKTHGTGAGSGGHPSAYANASGKAKGARNIMASDDSA